MPIVTTDNMVANRKPLSVVKSQQSKGDRMSLSERIKSAKWHNGLLSRVAMALPIISVNCLAVYFQWHYAQSALGHNPAISALFSCSLESTAMGVALSAHKARVKNLRSGVLFAFSILLGIGIGILNASHQYPNIPLSMTALLSSAISPWLWHIYTVQVSAPMLVKNGYLDLAGIRLGIERWVFHPIRCFQLKSQTSWDGERVLSRAIANYDRKSAEKATRKAVEKNVKSSDLDMEFREIRGSDV